MFHYAAAIVPIVIAATIMAVSRFASRGRIVAAAGCCSLSAASSWRRTRRTRLAQAFVFPETHPAARRAAMREAIALVPASAPVTATNRFGAHLSERRIIQLFPERRDAESAVIDTRNPWLPCVGEAAATLLSSAYRRAARSRSDWQLQFAREASASTNA